MTTRRSERALAIAFVALGLSAATGCTHVAPYERAKLAHPTMAATDNNPAGAEHVRAIQEGAIGGSSGAGSGCGCN